MTTKAPAKYIHIFQGPTTAVYSYRCSGTSCGIIVEHRPLRPVLFRKGKTFNR